MLYRRKIDHCWYVLVKEGLWVLVQFRAVGNGGMELFGPTLKYAAKSVEAKVYLTQTSHGFFGKEPGEIPRGCAECGRKANTGNFGAFPGMQDDDLDRTLGFSCNTRLQPLCLIGATR